MKKAFLFLLGLIATIGAWAQTSPYKGVELAEGDFFLYNVETGLWLQNNDGINRGEWNTRGAVGSYGFEFGVSAIEGGYQLNPKFGHNQSMNGSNFYLDTPDAVTAWTIEAKEASDVTNAYTIKFGDQVLSVNASKKLDYGAEANTWQFVTRDERIAYLEENASVDNPVDATFLIQDPGFAHENSRANAWTWARNGGNRDDVRVDEGDTGYRCRRSYAVWNTADFTLKQTITGAPNGKYELTIKGYYRDGNHDDVAARRTAGTERLLANYFVGESKAQVMSILDGAAETRSAGLFYYPDGENQEAPFGYYPDNAEAFNRIFQDYPEAYANEGVIGIVSDGTLVVGVEKIEANANDWFAFDDFRIKYLGNEIDLSEFLAALEAAIAAADEYNSDNTSTALKNALTEAYDNATAARTSTNQQEITAATSALNAALNAAKAVDVSVLKATAALAKAEGLDTSAADELVANATDGGAVASALFDLRAARKINAQRMPDIYTGSAPEDGAKVYIFNLGTGMFLGTGASYNTHCAVDQVGIEVELIADGDGFKIKTNRGSGWLAKGNRETTAYVDCPTQQVWHFLPSNDGEGIYNISFDGAAENLLGYNPLSVNDEGNTYWSSIGIKRTDVSDPNNQWKIVTAEEREALLAEASKENPVDASYLIGAASLNKQDNKDAAWTKDGGAWVDNFENHAFECWNADNFKLSQTIEGLKPGLYQVAVQAFWREGDGGNQAALANAGTLNQKAYLFANDVQVLLPNIASVTDFVPGVGGDARCNNGIFPNWVSEAIEYMETGAYWAVEDVVVEEDGTLTLGIAVDEKVAFGDWVVADNFRLTYLGNDVDDVNYERALASIEDGKTYRIFTETEDGTKLYLNPAGYLVDNDLKAATFTFNQANVSGAGYAYPTGWRINQFTNGGDGNNNITATTHIVVSGSNNRADFEAQVLFQNADGLYAVRSTNSTSTSWAASAFWTVVEDNDQDGLPNATYTMEATPYIWQIEENVDNRPEAWAKTQTWGDKLYQIEGIGLVTDKSMYYSNAIHTGDGQGYAGLLDGDYTTYFHTLYGNAGPDEDHYLQANLDEAVKDFVFYFKKRSQNNNNRPTNIIVSGSNDGENFTEITTISEGLPTGATPIDYTSAVISADEAYKHIRFTVTATNNGATTSNGHVFFTFSEFYIQPADGLWGEAAPYMVSDYTDLAYEDVDAINALDEQINGYFKEVDLNLVLNGQTLTSEKANVIVGKEAPEVPAAFHTNEEVVAAYGGLVYFTRDVDEISEETTEINYTAEDAISESFENAKWFNMNIRGSYWVAMDETEPYYPTADKDLEAAASQWAFGLTEDGSKLIIWNRAAGADKVLTNTGENDAADRIIVAMREGSASWDFAPSGDGFVIHQVGTGDNQWVNQNGGASGPLSIWDSSYSKGDGGSVLRIFPVDVEEEGEALELAVEVERYTGLGYDVTNATVDFTEAKEYLGVEEVTEDMLYFVNPDGTWIDYATYAVSPDPDFTYDGWCDGEGAAAQWGETTKVNVKFFQAIPDGEFTVCDMNGADELGKTYTVKWGLKANGKSVLYSINVTFVEAPVFDLTFDDLTIAQTEELDVESEIGNAYEGLNATVDVANILAALEVESLDDVTIAAVQPDGTLDLSYQRGTTDGWRDADGAWKAWANSNEVGLENCPYFYVKSNFESEPQLYEIGGYPGHTDEAAKFTAPYVFIVTGTAKAYLLNVNLIYPAPRESVAYEGTIDQTVSHPAAGVLGESTGDEQTVTITKNGDGTVDITYSGFTQPAPRLELPEFTVKNVQVVENEDGSLSYSKDAEQMTIVLSTGMNMVYWAIVEGTQDNSEVGPNLTLILEQRGNDGTPGMKNEIVFNPNAIEPEPQGGEYAGMIKQILSHPDTGVQGQATGEQTVKIEPAEDGKVNITYSGFTMPVTGAELPEFTVEGVEVTENEDGSICYALPEDAEAVVVIDRGTGAVTYKVALEGTQESAEAIPVLKLVLDNSVVDTVWFGENEKTIDKAIVTAINGLNAFGTEGTVFDLSGRKVEKIQRAGIYIVNGKKVAVK